MSARLEPPRYTSDGAAMLRVDAGLRVLHLQGSAEDMARQHGELLGPEIRAGGLPFMAGFLRSQLGGARGPWARLSARAQIAGVESLCRAVARNAPTEMRRAFAALADAAGVDRRTTELAVGTADVLLTVMAWLDRLQHIPHSPRPALLAKASRGFACSGAIALPEHTASGHLLHGRNMDYDGLGYTDRTPLVAFCRPDHGQPYAFITSAGLHTTALTAMNASGLMLGSNTAPTRDVSLRGVPFFALNEPAIREATTLGEAVDRLRQAGAASGYNVHLSHGPSGEAVVVEYSYSRVRVRTPQDGTLVTTNHYVHPDMAETTPSISLVDDTNTHRRYARLQTLLQAARGTLTLEGLAGCMRDTTLHGTDQSRPLGDVVCNFLNLTSVVADVTEKRFYASAGPAPAALGPYVGFELERELAAFGQPRDYPLQTLPAASLTHTPAMAALRHYQAAHASLSYRHEVEAAATHLEAAARGAPEEHRLTLARALVALKLDQPARASRLARAYLAIAPQDPTVAPRRYRAHLVRGWCADLEGRRHAARAHYARAREEHPGTAEAELDLAIWERRRFTRADQRRLHVDLFNTKRVLI